MRASLGHHAGRRNIPVLSNQGRASRMASKERNLDSGLVVVVFIITRQGALYIILPFITDRRKRFQHFKSPNARLVSREERGVNLRKIYRDSLYNYQSRHHGLLIPPLRGLRVVSGPLQEQHGNRERRTNLILFLKWYYEAR